MFTKEIKELGARKRLMVAEAGVYRGTIDLELATLRARLHATRESLRKGGPWLMAGTALASFLASRGGGGKLKGLFSMAMMAWSWIRRFKKQK